MDNENTTTTTKVLKHMLEIESEGPWTTTVAYKIQKTNKLVNNQEFWKRKLKKYISSDTWFFTWIIKESPVSIFEETGKGWYRSKITTFVSTRQKKDRKDEN